MPQRPKASSYVIASPSADGYSNLQLVNSFGQKKNLTISGEVSYYVRVTHFAVRGSALSAACGR